MDKLPQAKFFFLTFLNQFTVVNTNMAEHYKWLQVVRCALLSDNFNVEDHQNKL
jgi:hypothetical protein